MTVEAENRGRIVGLAAAGLAVRVLFDSSDELLTAADTLTSVRVWWVVAAVLDQQRSWLLPQWRTGLAGEPG